MMVTKVGVLCEAEFHRTNPLYLLITNKKTPESLASQCTRRTSSFHFTVQSWWVLFLENRRSQWNNFVLCSGEHSLPEVARDRVAVPSGTRLATARRRWSDIFFVLGVDVFRFGVECEVPAIDLEPWSWRRLMDRENDGQQVASR